MALGRAHNTITNNELRGLSSILSHELVSHRILKLVQVFCSITFIAIKIFTSIKKSNSVKVFRESLCLMIDYLSSEEKVVVANSKVDSVEAESLKLRKDLIEAMDQVIKAKEKVKELRVALKVEKMLVIQKDEEI